MFHTFPIEGDVGISHDENMFHKWAITAHLGTAVNTILKLLTGLKENSNMRKELREKAIKNSPDKVKNIVNIFSVTKNPFDLINENPESEKASLVNIYDGVAMNDKDADLLLHAREIGMKEVKLFIEERLQSDNANDFWNKQSKLNLPILASTNCTGKLVKASTKSLVKFDKTLFQRLLIVSQTRDINMEHVLSFELNDVPLSITHTSGEICKTCKSKLLQEFEVNEKIVALEISAHNTCVIIDLLGTVQRVSTINCVNFGDICIKLYNNVKQYLDVADILILVPYRYDVQNSLKTFERKRRCLSNTPKPIIQNSSTPLPCNFQQFLSNLRNKSNFVKFLHSELEKWFSRDISNTKEVYLGLHDGKTQHITYSENKEIGSLRSDHEEADSRIFVYGHYIGKNYSHTCHIT